MQVLSLRLEQECLMSKIIREGNIGINSVGGAKRRRRPKTMFLKFARHCTMMIVIRCFCMIYLMRIMM